MLRCIYQKEKRKGGISMFSQPFLVFLQVAESGSFSKAAARLLVTPASVMKHMNTLEGRLGLTLVRRSNRASN